MSDRPNAQDDLRDAFEEGQLEMIERNRRLWENTGNPIYVWRAIDHCAAIGMIHERSKSGKTPDPPWTSSYPYPDWCIGYLSIVAARISILSETKDYRLYPTPIGSVQPTLTSYRAADEQPQTVSGQKAVGLIPSALGFSGSGSNKFDAVKSLMHKELDALAYEDLKDLHSSSSRAMNALLEESEQDGVTDERAMKKRLAEVRRANGLPSNRKRAKPTT